VTDLARTAGLLLVAAREASDLVARIASGGDLAVRYKSGDDPVTRADREANELLVTRLGRALPGVPIVAEESAPSRFEGFASHDRVLFVDPVDGTREFVSGSPDYCVMVGLTVGGEASIGVIVTPATGDAYVGIVGEGAWRESESGAREPLLGSACRELSQARVLTSRSRRDEAMVRALDRLGARELVARGSVGVKAAALARGDADLYAFPDGDVFAWDSCAPEALVRAAGMAFTTARGGAFDYRRSEGLSEGGLLAGPPLLHAEALARLRAE
jgi:3'(2'), 5'-bisphosphate nucleotidase